MRLASFIYVFSSSESEDEETDSKVVDTKVLTEYKPSNKAVQWEDTQTEISSQGEGSEIDSLSNEDEEEAAGQEVKRIITFHHTPTPAILVSNCICLNK